MSNWRAGSGTVRLLSGLWRDAPMQGRGVSPSRQRSRAAEPSNPESEPSEVTTPVTAESGVGLDVAHQSS